MILLQNLNRKKINPRYFALILVLCFFLVPQTGEAARKKVVFQLSNLRQWAELEYAYTGKTLENDNSVDLSSRKHEIEETYHLEIDYAILDQKLANGSLEVELGLDQVFEDEGGGFSRSDNSTGFSLEYLLDLLVFERRPYPISLMSNLIQERVTAPFTENYDLTSQNLSAAVSWRNNYLPTRLSYRYYTTETSGLNIDRNQQTEELLLNASSTIGEFSESSLSAETRSRSTDFSNNSASTQTDTDELELHNLLRWGSLAKKNSLNSRYRLVDDTGTSKLRTILWNEILELQLGKALSTGLSYRYGTTESPLQDRRENSGRTWIEHRLFQSLTTRLQYTIDQTEYQTGDEQNWQYQAGFTYTKSLPRQSRLDLSYNHRYGETDRNLDDQQLTVVDEAFTVNTFLSGFLVNLDIIPESIVVFNSDRSIIYNLNSEYRINIIGRRTELEIIGGGIISGDTLSIDYVYQVNSSIDYATIGNSLSASLSLFGQRYRIYTTLSQTDQDLISGVADVSPLTQQTYAQIGLEGNFKRVSFGASYLYQDSTISTDKTSEVFVNYLRRKNFSLLNLRLTERYMTTQQNEGLDGISGDKENRNSLSFNADYRRQLLRNLTLNLREHVIDIRGQNRDQDDIFLGMILESHWYKFELLLSADVTWQIYDDSSSREDTVAFKIRRYF